MEKEKKSNEQTPSWLKTIQLNSWEAELLISALVLYALFQVPDALDDYSHRNFSRGSELIDVFRYLKSGILFLQIGYIMHILVRGIWVASVGFSYVFPGGINPENLQFKGKFKKELNRSSSLVKNVLKLEELSSMVYGLSFTIFGMFIGLTSLTFFFGLVLNYLSPYSQSSITENPMFFGFFTLLYALCLLLIFIDFITSGLFRRKEWAIDWFYPIAWFFRIITLSFLYRRSLLVLISNLKGWKSRAVSLIIAIILGGSYYVGRMLSDSQVTDYLDEATNGAFIMGNYENLRSDGQYLMGSIQSDIVQESFIKVFLKDISAFDSMIGSPYERSEIKWKNRSSDSSSYYLNKWLSVKIDSVSYNNQEWVIGQHPVERTYGFFTYLDINLLERGTHRLTISGDTLLMNKQEKEMWENSVYDGKKLVNITFQYDKP